MDSSCRNIVTTPGASEPQGSAVVGGSGVKPRSNVAGPLRSSSNDREGTGVASLAPATQKATSAETAVPQKGTQQTTLGDKQIASTFSTVKTLGKQLLAQDAAFKTLITKAGVLECVIEKTRSEQIKNAVQEILSALQVVRDSREQVTKSFNAVVETVKKEEAAKSMPQSNQVAESPKSVMQDMGTQSPCWWDASPRAGKEETPAPISGHTWSEVVRKKAKSQKTSLPPEPTKTGAPAKEQVKKQRRVRSRPSAILVDIKAEEFPELAKKIRGGVNKEVIGDSVLGMRQAKSGGLLIEIRGDQTRVEEVRAEISRSAGKEVPVRSLQQRAVVEVRDVDQWTTPEEVREAAASVVGEGLDSIKVLSRRKGFGGNTTVLMSVPIGSTKALLSSGRLRVGWVSCRIRIAEQRVRCFRCLSYGHMSRGCDGPDRTNCCRRCGDSGHKALNCSAPATAVSAFAKVVSAADGRRT